MICLVMTLVCVCACVYVHACVHVRVSETLDTLEQWVREIFNKVPNK